LRQKKEVSLCVECRATYQNTGAVAVFRLQGGSKLTERALCASSRYGALLVKKPLARQSRPLRRRTGDGTILADIWIPRRHRHNISNFFCTSCMCIHYLRIFLICECSIRQWMYSGGLILHPILGMKYNEDNLKRQVSTGNPFHLGRGDHDQNLSYHFLGRRAGQRLQCWGRWWIMLSFPLRTTRSWRDVRLAWR